MQVAQIHLPIEAGHGSRREIEGRFDEKLVLRRACRSNPEHGRKPVAGTGAMLTHSEMDSAARSDRRAAATAAA